MMHDKPGEAEREDVSLAMGSTDAQLGWMNSGGCGILGNLCKSMSSALTSPRNFQHAEQILVSPNMTFIGFLDW